ncbi:hypothetical protein QTP88_014101 [Uroleucon formosanum]
MSFNFEKLLSVDTLPTGKIHNFQSSFAMSTRHERDNFRKHPSGHQKRLKQDKKKQYLLKQHGAFDKFLRETSILPNAENTIENNDGGKEIQNNNSDNSMESDKLINENKLGTQSDMEIQAIVSDICDESDHIIIDDEQLIENKYGEVEIQNINSDNSMESDKLTIENKERIQSDMEIQESVSDIFDESNIIKDDEKNMFSEFDDIGCWPVNISQNIRTEIIKCGPKKVFDFEFPKNELNRKFNVSYYNRVMSNGEIINRVWLVYSISKDAVFCFCCKLFRTSLPSNLNNRSGLASEGISDWKHLSEKLFEHERTSAHNQMVKTWMELKIRISTLNTINKQHLSQIEKEKKHWRDVLVRVLAGIHYLAKYNDAFRGSSDVIYTEHNGKFLGYIETLAKFDPVIIEHVKRIKCKETHDHYLSHDIQDQLITLIANKIQKRIVNVIQKSKYYSVMMDCTPDVSHQEQLSLIIRVVDMDIDNEHSDPIIKEMFMEFINVESTTGLNLTNVLLEKLKNNNIDINNCRGQCYDNGANMKGQYKGVQARIKTLNSRAFFTPCAAHNLNLLLGDLSKSSTKAISFFGVVQRIYCLFSSSTGRWDILKKYCDLYTLKPLSETRWECRVNSVKALRFQLPSVIEALEEVSNTTNDPKTKSEAHSLVINELNSYEFVISLVIWYEILVEVNVVSKSLQSINMHLEVSISMLKGLIQFFEKYRNSGFHSAKITANKISEDLDINKEFKKTRKRVKKSHFSYEGPDNSIEDAELKFKYDFFNAVIDQALNSMNERFLQFNTFNNNFGFLYEIGQLKNMNNEDLMKNCKDLQNILSDGDSKDIDSIELYEELTILRNIIDDSKTALQILSLLKKMMGSFPNTYIALRIILTIPVTSATAERSFSKLKIIKNYLRNTISQDKLSKLALISIENKIAESLDYNDIIDIFASQKARKKTF